jgi:ABC-2 type transport system permease protein
VELMTGAHDRGAAFLLLARQWTWVAASLIAAVAMWNRGLRRFSAYGG